MKWTGDKALNGPGWFDPLAESAGWFDDEFADQSTDTANLDLQAQESSPDLLAGDVDVLVQASLQAQETGPDVLAAAAAVLVQADLAAQDGADDFTGTASVQRLANMDLAAQEGSEKDELIAQLQAQVAILQAQLAAAGSTGGFGGPDPVNLPDFYAERVERNNRLVMALVGSVVGGFGGGDQ